jgi:hypothetical protein
MNFFHAVNATPAIAQVAEGIVTNGLVGHWDAANTQSNQGGTTWYDLTANNRNFTLLSGANFDSEYGGSVSFYGINDYAQISSYPASKEETIIVYAKSNTTNWNNYGWLSAQRAANGHIIHPWINIREVRYYLIGSPTTKYYLAGSYTPASINIPRMYSVTTNGSNLHKMYVDGAPVLTATNSISRSSSVYNSTWYIGADRMYSRYGNGKIYVVLRYNRQLTDAEILQNYNELSTRF